MDTQKHDETPPESFEQASLLSPDAPARLPRFGRASRLVSASLPRPVARADDAGRPPFRLVWASAELGLKARVERGVGGEADRLVATVLSDRPEHLGKQARLELAAKPGWNPRSRQARGAVAAAYTAEALARLARELADSESDARRVAANAVGDLGAAAATPEILAGLVNLLADADRDLRRAAADAVGRLGSAAATPEILAGLAELLADPDAEVRRIAAEAAAALGRGSGTAAVVVRMAELLADPAPPVRLAALKAVGRLGAAAATGLIFERLAALLSDPDPEVQKAASRAASGEDAGGEDERRLLVAVELSTPRLDPIRPDAHKPVGCWGRTVLGTPDELRNTLGQGEIELSGFLLD